VYIEKAPRLDHGQVKTTGNSVQVQSCASVSLQGPEEVLDCGLNLKSELTACEVEGECVDDLSRK